MKRILVVLFSIILIVAIVFVLYVCVDTWYYSYKDYGSGPAFIFEFLSEEKMSPSLMLNDSGSGCYLPIGCPPKRKYWLPYIIAFDNGLVLFPKSPEPEVGYKPEVGYRVVSMKPEFYMIRVKPEKLTSLKEEIRLTLNLKRKKIGMLISPPSAGVCSLYINEKDWELFISTWEVDQGDFGYVFGFLDTNNGVPISLKEFYKKWYLTKERIDCFKRSLLNRSDITTVIFSDCIEREGKPDVIVITLDLETQSDGEHVERFEQKKQMENR